MRRNGGLLGLLGEGTRGRWRKGRVVLGSIERLCFASRSRSRRLASVPCWHRLPSARPARYSGTNPDSTMKNFVALLRGINVGGNHPLPMKDFARLLQALGAQGVQTYIQSGNAVFRMAGAQSDKLAAQIASAILQEFSFEPLVLVTTLEQLEQALAHNPYPEAQVPGNTLHLGFLADEPAHAELAKMEALRVESERFQITGQVFYLHAPEGIGRSKLAARAEKLLGVGMTLRNWQTACRLAELARQSA